MTPELRAAAERVRIGKYPHDPQGQARSYKDREMLIDAFLAANPADGDEGITEEWLRRMGFEPDSDNNYRHWEIACHFILDDGSLIWRTAALTTIATITTRFQLRNLLTALGIKP